MSKVIYFGINLYGHVNPSLPLVKELVDKGEKVIYYSSDEFKDRIEGVGATYKSYREDVDVGIYEGKGIDAFLVFADFILKKTNLLIESLYEEIKEENPDYIIHDTFCYWGREFAKMLQIPGISVFANFAFINEMIDKDPELFMENVLRTGDEKFYKKYKDSFNVCNKILDGLSRTISIKYNLDNINVMDDIFCSKEKLNILFTSKEFQIYSDVFDDTYLFVTPSVCYRKESLDFPFDRLYGRQVIYIAFGTLFNERIDIYKKCIDAFKDTEKIIILSIGKNLKTEDLGEIPSNFIVKNYVPQIDVLKHTDLFITHGGANSINEALSNAVPMVVVPQAFDQFIGAIMAENAGAGLYLKNNQITVADLKEAVSKVLNDKSYKDNCLKIKESFDNSLSIKEAVEEIFKYIKNN